jgi:hypothetical protein
MFWDVCFPGRTVRLPSGVSEGSRCLIRVRDLFPGAIHSVHGVSCVIPWLPVVVISRVSMIRKPQAMNLRMARLKIRSSGAVEARGSLRYDTAPYPWQRRMQLVQGLRSKMSDEANTHRPIWLFWGMICF